MRTMKFFFFSLSLFIFINSFSLFAADITNRLGIGFSRQLMNDVPALSMKIQKTEKMAFGAMFGLKSTDDNSGGYGAGIKLYRNLFVEPQLRFFSSGLFGIVSRKSGDLTQTGIQLDATLGTEFHFTGLESLGFTFEFGLSINKIGGSFNIETVGNHILLAGAHFYL